MLKSKERGIEMNKMELVKKVAEETNVSKKQVAEVLNSAFAAVTEAVAEGNKVQLIGFGTFEAKKRVERKGLNPRTKKALVIPASTVPSFKAGKLFKEKVNK